MQTLSEFLNIEENQLVVLEKIIEALRVREEWGKYGLFSKIGNEVGFSASYVSKSLTGKKPLRENFVLKMMDYLGVSAAWLCGDVDKSFEQEVMHINEREQYFDRDIFFNCLMVVYEEFLSGAKIDGVSVGEEYKVYINKDAATVKIFAEYDLNFSQVSAAMECVPEEKRLEVAVYVLAKALHESKYIITPPPAEEE